MKHPIPHKALDDRLGFIGTSGSGKTYNAGTAIEILLASRARTVIIDPLGVWWGLRLLADGKKPSGFDVVIFGGDHADLPLNDQAGALIGETAATMAESCIIDLSKLPSRAAERRFMVAFLETIYRKASGNPFHLVVDEADLFAPQKPQAGDEVLLGHMENIVRRGRVRGFIPWLISQRPAVLNKNVLSQVDGLLAFKLTAPQDIDALDSWIDGQADKTQGKAIKDALPTFPIGEGIVWLPGHGILARKYFPTKLTYDSSRKPKRGEKLASRKLKPLDVGKLEQQIAAVVEQAKASDVPTLQKRIRELEAAAKKAPAPAVDAGAITAAEARGFEQAKKKLMREAELHASAAIAAAMEAMDALISPIAITLKERIKVGRAQRAKLQIEFQSGPTAVKASTVDTPKRERATAPVTRTPSPVPTGGDGSLTPARQKILDAIAWAAALGKPAVAKDMVAFLAGVSPTSSGYQNNLGALRSAGLIEYPPGREVALTAEGAAVAVPPDHAPTHDDIMQAIAAKLAPAQMRILHTAAAAYPEDIGKEDLAGQVGASVTSSGYQNNLGRLRTLGFITYPNTGRVRAGESLFP